jgi:hypothetical protein
MGTSRAPFDADPTTGLGLRMANTLELDHVSLFVRDLDTSARCFLLA